MGNIFYFGWESDLIIWIQSWMSTVMANIVSMISAFGEELILVLILGVVYWGIDKKKGVDIGLNIMVIQVWPSMVKNIALRQRPYMAQPDKIQCLKPVNSKADLMNVAEQGYSFPSMHSSSATVCYGSIARAFKKKWLTVVATIIIVLVGLSRICLGNHYPTDVLAGWAMGLLIIFLIPWLRKLVKKDWVLFLIIGITAIPGIFFCKSTDYYTGLGLMIGFFFGVLFEQKYTQFDNTKNILRIVIRAALGGGLFLGLNTLLKIPFSKAFLDSATMGSFLVRTGRYAIIAFLLIGVYPLLFKVGNKIFKAK